MSTCALPLPRAPPPKKKKNREKVAFPFWFPLTPVGTLKNQNNMQAKEDEEKEEGKKEDKDDSSSLTALVQSLWAAFVHWKRKQFVASP